MSEQGELQQILDKYGTGRYLWQAGDGQLHDGDADVNWLMDQVAALTASLASLEREREDWMQRAKDYRAALLQEKAECDHLRSEVARLTTAPEKAEP
jgi:chromosome segregation ATPase